MPWLGLTDRILLTTTCNSFYIPPDNKEQVCTDENLMLREGSPVLTDTGKGGCTVLFRVYLIHGFICVSLRTILFIANQHLQVTLSCVLVILVNYFIWRGLKLRCRRNYICMAYIEAWATWLINVQCSC